MTLPLIGTGEAAKILGVTPERVRQLVRAGVIGAQELRRGENIYYLYAKSEVQRVARERARAAARGGTR